MKLVTLLDGAHAVSVSQTASKSTAVAACGNLGAGSTDVVVALAAAKGSRLSGIAWLHAAGDQTQVTVFVDQSVSGAGEQGSGGESDAG